MGEAKCLGGGSSLNAGLIWRTPDFIIESWKKITINIFNFDSYFNDIERLDIHSSTNDNLHSSRFVNGAKKLVGRL